MARDVQQIEQELAVLEEKVTKIAEEFQEMYRQYLEELGNAVQQQLTLAAYQICTQTYPEAFLRLSFNQRQQLQQKLRKLGHELKPELLDCQEQPYTEVIPDLDLQAQEVLASIQEKLQERAKEAADSPVFAVNELPFLGSLVTQEDESLSEEATQPEEIQPKERINPHELLQWCKNVEQAIAQMLESISTDVNEILQSAEILPNKLPPKLLEVALQAEEATEVSMGAPNTLNLLVETEDKSSKDPSLMHLTAIRLRLSEIEFAVPRVSLLRKQIRNLLSQVQEIRKTYTKKQQEKTVAEAQAAWRASWFED